MGDCSRRFFFGSAAAGLAVVTQACSGALRGEQNVIKSSTAHGRETLPAEQWQRFESARHDDAAPEDLEAPGFELVTVDSSAADVLRRRALEWPVQQSVETVDPERSGLAGFARRLERTMHSAGGVGIAAPQVGIGLRMVCVMTGARSEAPRTVFAINPRILRRSAQCVEGYEGCLSVPGLGGTVRRNSSIEVDYLDLDAQPQVVLYEGFDAIIWQHEIDHLDGVLYTDRVQGEPISAEEMRERRALEQSEQRDLEQEDERELEDQ